MTAFTHPHNPAAHHDVEPGFAGDPIACKAKHADHFRTIPVINMRELR